MDVLAKAGGLAPLVSTRLEHVCGPDALWMARRRGHKPVVKFLMTLPEIQQALEVFEKEQRDGGGEASALGYWAVACRHVKPIFPQKIRRQKIRNRSI